MLRNRSSYLSSRRHSGTPDVIQEGDRCGGSHRLTFLVGGGLLVAWWLIAPEMVPFFPMVLQCCIKPHSFFYSPEYVSIDNCSCVIATLLEARPRLAALEHLDVIAQIGAAWKEGRPKTLSKSTSSRLKSSRTGYLDGLGFRRMACEMLPPLRPVRDIEATKVRGRAQDHDL